MIVDELRDMRVCDLAATVMGELAGRDIACPTYRRFLGEPGGCGELLRANPTLWAMFTRVVDGVTGMQSAETEFRRSLVEMMADERPLIQDKVGVG